MFKKIVDKIIASEVTKRKLEIEEKIKEEALKIEQDNKEKLSQLLTLNNSLIFQIEEVKHTREKAEAEQKRLWERLNIIQDNLNTEKIYAGIYECAFSKAVDLVWDIIKNKVKDLVELARKDAYDEAEKNLAIIYEKRLQDIISKSDKDVNIPLLFQKKEIAHEGFLKADRVGNKKEKDFYEGQLSLLREVIKYAKTD